MKVSFTIPGPPKGKGRPRFSTAGKYPKAFTPHDTALYENLVRTVYMDKAGAKLAGAVKAEITAYFQIPKSASKKRKAMMASGEIKHASKPDADNIAKIVLDSLNGFAYDDDAAVAELRVGKRYSEDPRVEVVLESLESRA